MSKFCTNCGSEIEDSAKFCPKCGTPVRTVENAPKPMQVITPASANSAVTHLQAAGMENSGNKFGYGVLRILYYIAAVAIMVYTLTYHLPHFVGASIFGIVLILLIIVVAGGCWFVMGQLASKHVTYTKLLIGQILAFAVSAALLVAIQTGDREVIVAELLNGVCNMLFAGIALVTFVYLIIRTVAEHRKAK